MAHSLPSQNHRASSTSSDPTLNNHSITKSSLHLYCCWTSPCCWLLSCRLLPCFWPHCCTELPLLQSRLRFALILISFFEIWGSFPSLLRSRCCAGLLLEIQGLGRADRNQRHPISGGGREAPPAKPTALHFVRCFDFRVDVVTCTLPRPVFWNWWRFALAPFQMEPASSNFLLLPASSILQFGLVSSSSSFRSLAASASTAFAAG